MNMMVKDPEAAALHTCRITVSTAAFPANEVGKMDEIVADYQAIMKVVTENGGTMSTLWVGEVTQEENGPVRPGMKAGRFDIEFKNGGATALMQDATIYRGVFAKVSLINS